VLPASLILGVLAVALAWPVPLVLAKADWPSRAPATALVLWQAIALAGALSMIGSLLTFGLIPFGPDLPSALAGFAAALTTGTPAPDVAHLLALCGAILLSGHLMLNAALTLVRSGRDRRRHRRLVDLLGTSDPARPGMRILDSAVPMAYCLPAFSGSMTVFSAGLLELLDEAEVRAVVEHERAHLRQRHDLLLVAFRAWRVSLPWFPVASRAEREVGRLVELLADDRARRTVPAASLARAIALIGGSPDLPDRSASLTRIARLSRPAAPLPSAGAALVVVSAVALPVLPTALLLVPIGIAG
jgi:Zn-dependent protease with chaperone function